MSKNPIIDITIIGGGPTGLFAAFYAGMRQMSVKVIESMPQLGGQLSALYPEKYIYDVAGFPKVRAQELVDNLIEQAKTADPIYCLDEKVLNVEKRSDGIFELTTTKGVHLSRAVVITAGCGAFEPRKLNLPEAERFEGKGLYYFVNDMQQFAGKKVLIAGGGDSAVDWALMLEPIADSVTLIHRRDRFRAHEHSVQQMMKSSIQVITPREIQSIHGDERIEKVTIVNKQTGETEELKADSIIVSFGFVSSLGPIKNWGLKIEKGSILVNSKMETTFPASTRPATSPIIPGK